MAIDRRAVLSGLLVAPVVLHLPMQAAAGAVAIEPEALPQHPLFGVHEAEIGDDGRPKVRMLAARMLEHPGSGPRLGLKVGDVPLELGEFVGFKQAENEILARIVRDATICEGIPTATDVQAANVLKIVRVSNRIAARMRRGAGNVALMHDADVVHLEERFYGRDTLDDVRIGRWKRFGFVNANMTIWTTRDDTAPIPRGFVLVGRKGSHEIDCGAHIARTSHDCYGIAMEPPQTREEVREGELAAFDLARFYSREKKFYGPILDTLTIKPSSMTSYFGMVELTTPENRPLGWCIDGKPLFDKYSHYS